MHLLVHHGPSYIESVQTMNMWIMWHVQNACLIPFAYLYKSNTSHLLHINFPSQRVQNFNKQNLATQSGAGLLRMDLNSKN